MDLNEYQSLAARTAAMDTTHEIRLATFALGLVCEATEVVEAIANGADSNTLEKELGDVMWYVAALCTENDILLSDAVEVVNLFPGNFLQEKEENKAKAIRRLTIWAGKTGDFMKKVIGHGHDFDRERLCNGLQEVVIAITDLCFLYNIDFETVMKSNIAKLKRRYPEGFSSEASINRTA